MILVVVALVTCAGYPRFESADMTAIISSLTRPLLPLT
jgi:hypothetical protein